VSVANVVKSETVDQVDLPRERLLRAALEVLAERGFGDTRLTDIAERAGVSPALVVYYFKTKDGVLTEAIRLGEHEWYEAVAKRLSQHKSAARRLEEIVAMTCFGEDSPEVAEPWSLWIDLWSQSVRHEDVGNVRREFDVHWRSTLRDLVVEGQKLGEFRKVDADDFAVAFSALLDGFAVQFALNDPDVGPERAFALSMTFATEHLGFKWKKMKGSASKASRARRY
jgi:AcrR family transcriptional regulator